MDLDNEEQARKLKNRLESMFSGRKKRYLEAQIHLQTTFLSEEDAARALKLSLTSRQAKQTGKDASPEELT